MYIIWKGGYRLVPYANSVPYDLGRQAQAGDFDE